MVDTYHAFLVCVGLPTVFYLTWIIYQVCFHPFSKIPGPPLARVSRIWSRLSNLEGRRYDRIHQAHRKYGPVVRIGPNELSFADPKAVRDIYTSDVFVKEQTFYVSLTGFDLNLVLFHAHLSPSLPNVSSKKIIYSVFGRGFFGVLIGEGLMFGYNSNPEGHKQRRKLLSRGFSQAALLDYEPSISNKIETMLDKWAALAKEGRPVNVYPWAHWLGFDTVYHLLFGVDPKSLSTESQHEVIPYLRAWRPTYIYKEFFPQMETLGPYVPGTVGDYFRNVKAWKEYSVSLIRQTRDDQVVTPFLKTVLNGEKDGYLQRPLTDSELAEECMGGMFGGTGTTANTFIYILWATLQRPDIVAKLKAELKEAIPDSKVVPSHQLCASLPYLQAVINETLRLYPTIIATLPRTARQATTVAGVPIPKGAIVGTQNYTVHRWEPAFPEPEEFRPERWLGDDISEEQKEAFVPFSIGSRRCIGINLAQMELGKVTASFFRRFDASLDPSVKPEDMQMFDTFSASPSGDKLPLWLTESED